MGKYWVGTGKNRHRTAAGIKHEHDKFQSSPEARKANSARVTARRSAMRKGLVHKGDGMEVHHKDSNPRNNSSSNLSVISRSANRGKRENSRKRGSGRNRKNWGK